MPVTRSGKNYKYEPSVDAKLRNAERTIVRLNNQYKLLKKEYTVCQETKKKEVEAHKSNYVSVLGLLVNRQANYRILTLCIEKIIEDSGNNREYDGEKECCVCYNTTSTNLVCKNGHSMGVSCLSSWNWANRSKDFMESTNCPCCRDTYIKKDRDAVFTLAGIGFKERQVTIA